VAVWEEQELNIRIAAGPAVSRRYKCFGCGAGGEVVVVLMMVEHLEFDEARQVLAWRATLGSIARTVARNATV
jgi:hypothetical protein